MRLIDADRFRRFAHEQLDEYNVYSVDEIFEMIDEQPTVEAKPVEWIPCSERLPEDGQKVLVWFEYFRYGDYNCLYKTIGISYTWNGKWSGFVNDTSGWQKLRIIAWMPLPEAYKGGE